MELLLVVNSSRRIIIYNNTASLNYGLFKLLLLPPAIALVQSGRPSPSLQRLLDLVLGPP